MGRRRCSPAPGGKSLPESMVILGWEPHLGTEQPLHAAVSIPPLMAGTISRTWPCWHSAAPTLSKMFAGYEAVHPMPAGWAKDLPAHNFFALLAHVENLHSGSWARPSLLRPRSSTRRKGLGRLNT